MIRRLLKEMVAFPLLALHLCVSPLTILGARISSVRLRRTHQEIATVLEKNGSLERLLAYAREQNVLFSKHRTQKKEGWLWFVTWKPPSRTDTLLEKFKAFLNSIDDTGHRPTIYVQMDTTGNIQPRNDLLLVHFLSHELGHLRNRGRERKKCSWARPRTACLKDELLATLAGIKILTELGYPLDFPSLAYQWTTDELMTGRCAECIYNASCQDALKGLLTISQEEKGTTSYTVNYKNIFEAVDDL